jgi:pimeloyl-ACP methyl ester carboxylesterase
MGHFAAPVKRRPRSFILSVNIPGGEFAAGEEGGSVPPFRRRARHAGRQALRSAPVSRFLALRNSRCRSDADMTEIRHLDTSQDRRIAYAHRPGKGPGVVFLGGFKSDMEGTKALHLEAWCQGRGQAFLRFDYSGHGQSSGAFTDGAIGDWAEDALTVIEAVTEGPQILVGSSMGGWIALLVALARPDRVAGLVGIAAAPDFTRRMWAEFSAAQQAELREAGQVARPSDYGEPYIITRRLIEEGARHFVMDTPLRLSCPLRLLQGTADADVPWTEATRLLEHVEAADARLTLVKGADHRFSSPECLALIERAVAELGG